MAQEHQEYIQTRVNPTLENLVTQVLLERPENPVPFMIQWLAQQTKATPQLETGEAERLRTEINGLSKEVAELEGKLAAVAPAPPPAAVSQPAPAAASEPAAAYEKPEESEEEDDDADVEDMPPPPASYMNKGQRASVSAEAYGQWNPVKEFKPPVHSKTEDQKARLTSVLQISFLFQGLAKADLDTLVDAMVEKEVAANERIIKEGDDGDCMYVIEKGNIECLKVINGEEKVVKECTVGSFFGELALMYNCPRAASVEARDAAVLWQLDRETFNHIVRDASMKKRDTYGKFLKSVPILETLGETERESLVDSLHQESVAAGSTVIKQGEVGDRFYLISGGELVASKQDGDEPAREVNKYGPGDYFGELALIKNETRAATITATTDAELLWLNNKTFKLLLGPIEEIMKRKADDYKP